MTQDSKIVQLGKHRVARTGEAASWTPREACIEMLRQIDAGLNVKSMIICYDGIDGAGFQNSTGSVMEAIGLLQVTQLEVYERGRN